MQYNWKLGTPFPLAPTQNNEEIMSSQFTFQKMMSPRHSIKIMDTV